MAQNMARMRAAWPSFACVWKKGIATWTGKLQPQEWGHEYVVKIRFGRSGRPVVHVLDLDLVPRPPHIFPDGSLCLFKSSESRWSRRLAVADTIVPWTAEWLLFYELWRDTGKWWGPEAPHDPQKQKTPDD